MSEARFTKAPWRAFQAGGRVCITKCKQMRTQKDFENSMLVQINGADMEANAHLIAAAPEMYEMLEAMLYNSFQNCEIEALLKKARGEV